MPRHLSELAVLTLSFFAIAVGAAHSASSDIPIGTATPTDKTSSMPEAAPAMADLVGSTPDGGDLKALYKATRTVAGIEVANRHVRDELSQIESLEADLTRRHIAVMTSCEVVGQLDPHQTEAISLKVRSLATTLLEIEVEMKKSFDAMRSNNLRQSGVVAFRSSQDIQRYEMAYGDFGQLRVNAEEKIKTIDVLVSNITRTARSCSPAEIPPLFAPNNLAGIKSVPTKPVKNRAHKPKNLHSIKKAPAYMSGGLKWTPDLGPLVKV